jgi:hypothetical protein
VLIYYNKHIKREVMMELESIGSYIILTFILGFFSIGLLSNFFFPFFMNENEKINKEYKDIPLD